MGVLWSGQEGMKGGLEGGTYLYLPHFQVSTSREFTLPLYNMLLKIKSSTGGVLNLNGVATFNINTCASLVINLPKGVCGFQK